MSTPTFNIIIVGAGGFGKEVRSYISDDKRRGFLNAYTFKGYVDDSFDNFLKLNTHEPYLGSVDGCLIEPNDRFIVAIGNVRIRNRIIASLESRGAQMMRYIHHSSFVADDAHIGEGVLIAPFCMVQSNATLGKHTVLNIYCSVAHDSILGEGSILSPYCTLNGNVTTGANLFMGTRSTLLPGTILGTECMVAAHSVIKGSHEGRLLLKTKFETQKQINRFI